MLGRPLLCFAFKALLPTHPQKPTALLLKSSEDSSIRLYPRTTASCRSPWKPALSLLIRVRPCEMHEVIIVFSFFLSMLLSCICFFSPSLHHFTVWCRLVSQCPWQKTVVKLPGSIQSSLPCWNWATNHWFETTNLKLSPQLYYFI